MHCRSNDGSFIKIKDEIRELLDGESVLTNYPLHFLKSTEACKGCKNKKINNDQSRFFSQRMEYEDHITKVIERNAGLLLILHKTKVLVL